MSQLIPFKLSNIFELVSYSKKNEDLIREEFKKMVEYYKVNPDVFLDDLLNSKDYLESIEFKTESDNIALDELYDILDSVLDPEKYFLFSEEMLLNDFSKIYKQIKKNLKSINEIRDNAVIEVHYYTIVNDLFNKNKNKIAKNSSIAVEKISLKTMDFLLQYQMLYN